MLFDIETVNKQNFVCLKFDDGQIYFGEVGYVNDQKQIIDISNGEITEEEKSKLQKVRHGIGVQLFSQVDQEGFVSKYEGHWHLDRKHGEAKCTFPDTSIYQGTFTYDTFDKFGRYQWPNGDIYEGLKKQYRYKFQEIEKWGGLKDRDVLLIMMGIYQKECLKIIISSMLLNQFCFILFKESELYISPFMDEAEMKEFILLRKDIDKQKDRNYNLKQFKFEKIVEYANAEEFIKKSIENNRIPMILSSKQLETKLINKCNQNRLGLTKNQLIEHLKAKMQKNIFEFNLRDILIEKKKKGNCKEYLEKTKQALSNILTKGEIFLLNLDETEQSYEEIYDPDLREFYSATQFPSQIWEVNLLKRPEVYEKILSGTTNKPSSKISSNFSIIIWSKFQLDQSFDNQKVMEKFERRFSTIIPTQKIDLILMSLLEKKQEEEVVGEKKAPPASKRRKKR